MNAARFQLGVVVAHLTKPPLEGHALPSRAFKSSLDHSRRDLGQGATSISEIMTIPGSLWPMRHAGRVSARFDCLLDKGGPPPS